MIKRIHLQKSQGRVSSVRLIIVIFCIIRI
jgi:hypothetical protein